MASPAAVVAVPSDESDVARLRKLAAWAFHSCVSGNGIQVQEIRLAAEIVGRLTHRSPGSDGNNAETSILFLDVCKDTVSHSGLLGLLAVALRSPTENYAVLLRRRLVAAFYDMACAAAAAAETGAKGNAKEALRLVDLAGRTARAMARSGTLTCFCGLLQTATETVRSAQAVSGGGSRAGTLASALALLAEAVSLLGVVGNAVRAAPTGRLADLQNEMDSSPLLEHLALLAQQLSQFSEARQQLAAQMLRLGRALEALQGHRLAVQQQRQEQRKSPAPMQPCLSYLLCSHVVLLCTALDGQQLSYGLPPLIGKASSLPDPVAAEAVAAWEWSPAYASAASSLPLFGPDGKPSRRTCPWVAPPPGGSDQAPSAALPQCSNQGESQGQSQGGPQAGSSVQTQEGGAQQQPQPHVQQQAQAQSQSQAQPQPRPQVQQQAQAQTQARAQDVHGEWEGNCGQQHGGRHQGSGQTQAATPNPCDPDQTQIRPDKVDPDEARSQDVEPPRNHGLVLAGRQQSPPEVLSARLALAALAMWARRATVIHLESLFSDEHNARCEQAAPQPSGGNGDGAGCGKSGGGLLGTSTATTNTVTTGTGDGGGAAVSPSTSKQMSVSRQSLIFVLSSLANAGKAHGEIISSLQELRVLRATISEKSISVVQRRMQAGSAVSPRKSHGSSGGGKGGRQAALDPCVRQLDEVEKDTETAFQKLERVAQETNTRAVVAADLLIKMSRFLWWHALPFAFPAMHALCMRLCRAALASWTGRGPTGLAPGLPAAALGRLAPAPVRAATGRDTVNGAPGTASPLVFSAQPPLTSPPPPLLAQQPPRQPQQQPQQQQQQHPTQTVIPDVEPTCGPSPIAQAAETAGPADLLPAAVRAEACTPPAGAGTTAEPLEPPAAAWAVLLVDDAKLVVAASLRCSRMVLLETIRRKWERRSVAQAMLQARNAVALQPQAAPASAQPPGASGLLPCDGPVPPEAPEPPLPPPEAPEQSQPLLEAPEQSQPLLEAPGQSQPGVPGGPSAAQPRMQQQQPREQAASQPQLPPATFQRLTEWWATLLQAAEVVVASQAPGAGGAGGGFAAAAANGAANATAASACADGGATGEASAAAAARREIVEWVGTGLVEGVLCDPQVAGGGPAAGASSAAPGGSGGSTTTHTGGSGGDGAGTGGAGSGGGGAPGIAIAYCNPAVLETPLGRLPLCPSPDVAAALQAGWLRAVRGMLQAAAAAAADVECPRPPPPPPASPLPPAPPAEFHAVASGSGAEHQAYPGADSASGGGSCGPDPAASAAASLASMWQLLPLAQRWTPLKSVVVPEAAAWGCAWGQLLAFAADQAEVTDLVEAARELLCRATAAAAAPAAAPPASGAPADAAALGGEVVTAQAPVPPLEAVTAAADAVVSSPGGDAAAADAGWEARCLEAAVVVGMRLSEYHPVCWLLQGEDGGGTPQATAAPASRPPQEGGAEGEGVGIELVVALQEGWQGALKGQQDSGGSSLDGQRQQPQPRASEPPFTQPCPPMPPSLPPMRPQQQPQQLQQQQQQGQQQHAASSATPAPPELCATADPGDGDDDTGRGVEAADTSGHGAVDDSDRCISANTGGDGGNGDGRGPPLNGGSDAARSFAAASPPASATLTAKEVVITAAEPARLQLRGSVLHIAKRLVPALVKAIRLLPYEDLDGAELPPATEGAVRGSVAPQAADAPAPGRGGDGVGSWGAAVAAMSGSGWAPNELFFTVAAGALKWVYTMCPVVVDEPQGAPAFAGATAALPAPVADAADFADSAAVAAAEAPGPEGSPTDTNPAAAHPVPAAACSSPALRHRADMQAAQRGGGPPRGPGGEALLPASAQLPRDLREWLFSDVGFMSFLGLVVRRLSQQRAARARVSERERGRRGPLQGRGLAVEPQRSAQPCTEAEGPGEPELLHTQGRGEQAETVPAVAAAVNAAADSACEGEGEGEDAGAGEGPRRCGVSAAVVPEVLAGSSLSYEAEGQYQPPPVVAAAATKAASAPPPLWELKALSGVACALACLARTFPRETRTALGWVAGGGDDGSQGGVQVAEACAGAVRGTESPAAAGQPSPPVLEYATVESLLGPEEPIPVPGILGPLKRLLEEGRRPSEEEISIVLDEVFAAKGGRTRRSSCA